MDMVNNTIVRADDGGYLIVTVQNKQNGTVVNGTVCVEHYDSKSAALFCRELGFVTGWWDVKSVNREIYQ